MAGNELEDVTKLCASKMELCVWWRKEGRSEGGGQLFKCEELGPGLRLRVLVEVLLGLPMALAARRRIGRWAGLSRWRVWREWAGP